MSLPKTFTAIDFETANHNRNSICAVGLVRVVDGKISEKLDFLIQPPNNEYHYIHTGVHKLTARDTAKSPTFNKIWPTLLPFIKNQNIVAHNITFDAGVLLYTLEHYKIEIPYFEKHCTMKLFDGRNLSDLCYEYNITLDHHNALSDATACAKLFLLHQKLS